MLFLVLHFESWCGFLGQHLSLFICSLVTAARGQRAQYGWATGHLHVTLSQGPLAREKGSYRTDVARGGEQVMETQTGSEENGQG